MLRTPSGNTVIIGDEPEGDDRRAHQGRCEIVLDPKAGRVTVQAGEVVVRGSGGEVEELATKTFVTQVFDMHTTRPASARPQAAADRRRTRHR